MITEVWMNCLSSRSRGMMLLAALLLLAPLGCGGSGATTDSSEMTEDQMKVSALVGGVSDMASTLRRLRESFTKKAAPKSSDLKKFSSNSFEVADTITVTGNTASFNVNISPYTSEAVVTKPWKAEKVGDEWKLSDTPLP